MSNLSYFFSSFKNAVSAKRKFFYVNNSRFVFNFLQVLYNEGLIESFSIDRKNCRRLYVELKYQNNYPIILGFKQVSKSSQNIYCNFNNLFVNLNKEGVFFFTTSNHGIISNLKVGSCNLFLHVGGKVLSKLLL